MLCYFRCPQHQKHRKLSSGRKGIYPSILPIPSHPMKYLLLIPAAALCMTSCGKNDKNSINDALDRRPNEQLRDAGENIGDSVDQAAKDIGDAVERATE